MTTVLAADRDTWLRTFHPSPDPIGRLVCFPHAGGSASYFHALSRALAPQVEVIAVQYPGRQDRRHESLVNGVLPLAHEAARVLAPLAGDVSFFGHSMGSAVAYEVARIMAADGNGPRTLFASGRRPPSVFRQENVHRRDDDGLVAEMRALAGTADDLLDDAELLALVLPVVRNDFRAIETYHSPQGPVLECPIVMCTGAADSRVSRQEALGWRDHTRAEFELAVFPGGHFYFEGRPDALARRITAHLRERR